MDDYKKTTIESYDRHAAQFSRKLEANAAEQDDSDFQSFFKEIPGKRILDLGCGSGQDSVYFVKMGYTVTSVDLSHEMIRLCVAKGLHASVMDIENLQFSENSFDGIWAIASLLHIPKSKIPAVIEKLHTILTNNGLLFVSVKKGFNEEFVQDKTLNCNRFFSYWQKEEFQSLFHAKFKLVLYSELKGENNDFLNFLFRKK